MFVRKKKTSWRTLSSGKKVRYQYYHLVENIWNRKKEKPEQKEICYIGKEKKLRLTKALMIAKKHKLDQRKFLKKLVELEIELIKPRKRKKKFKNFF